MWTKRSNSTANRGDSMVNSPTGQENCQAEIQWAFKNGLVKSCRGQLKILEMPFVICFPHR